MPDTPRYHGDPFNEHYEQWVRLSTGGPADREYRVEHNGELAWFDASVVEVRHGVPTEVLIDAKGRYAQFLDDTGDWKRFWTKAQSGMADTMDKAVRQVRVANGRPVEWWCAEKDAAAAFNDAFLDNDVTRGRIRAVNRPRPKPETGG